MHASIRRLVSLFFWLYLFQRNSAAPADIYHSISESEPLKGRQNGGSKPLLRIMPVGASITQGLDQTVLASQQNGYRKLLRDQLRYWGYEVNMVGIRSNGDFSDRQHEGHPGLEIDQIVKAMSRTLTKQFPNLVLINAGTNDCVRANEHSCPDCWVRETKDRIKAMIDSIYKESEGVTIILSTLYNNQDPITNNYVNIANEGYRSLVRELRADGKKIELADMNTGWITLSDHSDPTHPNSAGYKKMASVWAAAFKSVESKGWLRNPKPMQGEDDPFCYPSPDGFSGPLKTQQGSGWSDGNYEHSSSLDYKLEYNEAAPEPLIGEWNHFHFAQLVSLRGDEDNGKPLDELVRILDPDDRVTGNAIYMSYRLNNGDGDFAPQWTPIDIVQQGTPECLSRGVRFGDVNGDGLDDFICVNLEGSLFVSLNRGGTPPTFEFIGKIKDDRFPQRNVRITDIDGDGRADLCGLDNDGSVTCWRNGGTGDAPIAKYDGYWQGMLLGGGGPVFDANSMVEDNRGVNLVDINGDGYADWIYFHPDTSSEIYINQRGSREDGSGLKPHWVRAANTISGWPNDPKVNTSHIMFGNVYGSGRADLVRVEQVGENNDYEFNLHRNTGNGGTRVKGDGAKYCDMFGSGYDDYLWVWDGGMVDLFRNVNPGSDYMWKDEGRILETATNRKYLHFGDWDGDGLCDVLAVERHTGNVRMWRNTWRSGTKPTFAAPITVVSGGQCPQPYSVSRFDLAVRFGDLDGDGRVDYICMDSDGRSRGWLNKAGGIEALSPNQIKVSVGYDRANHRWADVNGDGRVDFLWVDKHFGGVKTWINGGIKPALDSSMYWDAQPDIWMPGVERGHNIHFPKLTFSGRADYHWVHPQDGTAWTYFNNECSSGDGNSGGPDDGVVVNPALPDCPGTCTSPDGPSPTTTSLPDPTSIHLPDPTCLTTLSGPYPASPTDLDEADTPVEAYNYMSIGNDCYYDTNVPAPYQNRGEFVERAIKDMTSIANIAAHWPGVGLDVSDLYIGGGAENSQWALDIKTNLNMTAQFGSGRRQFWKNYVVVVCIAKNSQQDNAHCKSKIGSDPRSIGGYVNNTYSWWWNKSYISLCGPFFESNTIAQAANNGQNDDPNNIDLRYYQTSGSLLLHEMMHTLEVTGTNGEREHIIDATFDGARGRRIYGPPDVAKAARISGVSLTHLNADTYAQFASAMYWKAAKGADRVPQPKISDVELEIWQDAVGDTSANYQEVCLQPPEDFNCDCDESGCSEDSAPCCASGSCECDCDESGCAQGSPSCCASGTCNF